jgi:hypothetical protein
MQHPWISVGLNIDILVVLNVSKNEMCDIAFSIQDQRTEHGDHSYSPAP